MEPLDETTWETKVEQAEGWVLVDFWSPKCEPCLKLKPKIRELANQDGHIMDFYTLDITKARRLAISQRVLGLPVVAFYHQGVRKQELTSEITPEEVETKIRELTA